MIRQKQRREILTKIGMARHEESLTLQGKNMVTNISGQNLRPSSKNGWDSKAPGLHLSLGCGDDTVVQLTEAGMSPEGATRSVASPREHQRERENQPPTRRPLKLAPLKLPKEVKESQRQKIKGIQQEALIATRKLDTLGNEPHSRKARTYARSGQARSPERSPRRPLHNPAEREAPRLVKAQIPRATGGDRGERARGQTALPSRLALPPSLDVQAQAACTGEATVGNPGTFQDASRRRLRLRRAQWVDEDQSKSSLSTTSGLSTGEGKEGPTGDENSQRVEKVLREASRALYRESGKGMQLLRQTGNLERSGKSVKRMVVSDNQDGAL